MDTRVRAVLWPRPYQPLSTSKALCRLLPVSRTTEARYKTCPGAALRTTKDTTPRGPIPGDPRQADDKETARE